MKAKNRPKTQAAEAAWLSSLKVQTAILAVTLVVAAILLFARLGQYTLWDDESLSALAARGVLRTGDTSILMDHGNIVAARAGLHVRDFCDRGMPPLPAYVTAASFAVLGQSAWIARLPSAVMGLATIALILFWARREGTLFLLLMALGLIGNVSMLLFARQCRYYAMAMLFSTAIVLIYARARPTTRNLLALAALSSLLFSCQYLNYIALYLCLAVDYVFWRRKEWPLTWRGALCLFGPQIVINGLVGWIWNPFSTQLREYEAHSGLFDRFVLAFWYWRDTNAAEFDALIVVLAALGVGIVQRRMGLVRGCVALAIFITAMGLISEQPISITSLADIRYVAPIIPLAIVLEAGAICALLGRWPWLAVGAAVLVFGTNLFNGGPLLDRGFHSTICDYVGELVHPVPEPYTPTADWINANVPEGESVWVLPDYSAYPLMFRAPRAVYAWQLDWPPRPDFAQLPAIHFKGQQPPDYLVAFGPFLGQMEQAMQAWDRPDVHYDNVATLPVFWKDLYRPELFWRTFTPVPGFDPNSQAVYIFKRTNPPIVAPTHPPAAR